MDLSIFLAKVIGLYMLFVGMVVLKKPSLQEVINKLSKDEDLRFVLGLFTLILGLLLVVGHNVWDGTGYQIVITIISWIVLLKSLLIVWLSNEKYNKIMTVFNTHTLITVSGIINLILGIYLTYVGFFV